MHELSICEAIYAIADRAAGGRRVDWVDVTIGQFRQVVPETLAHCWAIVVTDTALGGSRLRIDSVPVRISCPACGFAGPVGELSMPICPHCDSARVRIVTGEEFEVTSLELAGPQPGEGGVSGTEGQDDG